MSNIRPLVDGLREIERARTWIFTPADSASRLRGTADIGAHGVIADLEDGVAPEAKDDARGVVGDLYAHPRLIGEPLRFLRINSDPRNCAVDLELASRIEIDGIVVPKAGSELLETAVGISKPIVALVETAAAVRAVDSLASHAGVVALMLGAADLQAELGLETREDGLELLHARTMLVLASASAGIRAPIDGVFLDLADDQGLRRDAERSRTLGMYGKAAVHPRQLEAIDLAFTPEKDEVRHAERVIEAFDLALAQNKGATLLDGRLIDLPIADRARLTLARARVPNRGGA